MDILLVQCKPRNELYDARYQSENLALGYLAASLRNAGFETGVLDAHLSMMEPEETVSYIINHSPWMVGISASAQDTIRSVIEVIEMLRAEGYRGHITIGGHFPTYEHYQLLSNVPELDSVVRGEGEITVVELAQFVQNNKPLSEVKGITYRDHNGEVVVNPDRPLVEDLDTLPLPHRDTLDILLAKNRRVSMLASRGCYARCSFCSIQTFFNYRPRRVRKVDHVVREMTLLYELGVRKFKFVDDLFMDPSKRSKEWVLEFCRKVKEAKLENLNLWLQVRAVCVTEEIFTALKEIGLKKIFLGLESGHADTLKRYRKDITPEQNIEAVRILKKVGIPEISIGMMPFEPDVTLEGMKENIEFLKKLGTFDIRDVTGRFLPYAGTPLTEKLLAEGRIKRKTWYDIGTYDFTDPRVDQLYRMVMTYYRHAKPSLKLIYKMDGLIRKLEAHFLHPDQQKSYPHLFQAYQELRKNVEAYIQDHGDMMLKLVEDTIDAIESRLTEVMEQQFYERSQKQFQEAEQMTTDLFAQIESLQQKLHLPTRVKDEERSIHVAEVKVLTKREISTP